VLLDGVARLIYVEGDLLNSEYSSCGCAQQVDGARHRCSRCSSCQERVELVYGTVRTGWRGAVG
jgi:hypothetical protein